MILLSEYQIYDLLEAKLENLDRGTAIKNTQYVVGGIWTQSPHTHKKELLTTRLQVNIWYFMCGLGG